jgi:hypothetical protein
MNIRFRLPILIAALTLVCSPALAQGTKPAPKTQKPPAKSAPATKKPSPAAAMPAPPPPPTDVRYKTKYTTGAETTESVTFITDQRERYELGDIILIRQRDHKRNVQFSRSANSYVIVTDDAPAEAAAAAPGVVNVSVSIVDLGERKDVFGQTARRVRTVMQREPESGACDQTKALSQTDAWYIDMPKVLAAAPAAVKPPTAASGCADDIRITETGDARLIGFPISYTTSLTDLSDKDAKPVESSMEVTEFEVLKLDAALFDIPAGATAAAGPREFTKAISDANEARLARGAAETVAPAKKPGTLRVGVPEVANQTSQPADTRALRTRIINELEQQKIEAVPMAAGSQAELDARARELGVDYLVLAEVTELKVSKPGGFTKVLKATAKEEARDITEAKLSMQLVAPGGGRPRVSKNATGKDGGVGFKTGLKVAKFAGKVYLKFYMGGMMANQLSAFASAQMMNMGGMGSMGSMMPVSSGGSFDRTAGAANYVMQQVMMGATAGSQSGPSFDAALEDAIEDAGKDVIESIKRAPPARK